MPKITLVDVKKKGHVNQGSIEEHEFRQNTMEKNNFCG